VELKKGCTFAALSTQKVVEKHKKRFFDVLKNKFVQLSTL